MTLGFLDDVTLGGPVKTVASDVEKIISAGTAMGLSLKSLSVSLLLTKTWWLTIVCFIPSRRWI